MANRAEPRFEEIVAEIRLGYRERDQHADPDNVQKMPVARAVINGPMSLVIVSIPERLVDYETEKHHAAQNM